MVLRGGRDVGRGPEGGEKGVDMGGELGADGGEFGLDAGDGLLLRG